FVAMRMQTATGSITLRFDEALDSTPERDWFWWEPDDPVWTGDDEGLVRRVWFLTEADLEGGEGELVGEPFVGVIQWPALDLGELGRDKQLVGFDLVGKGEVSVSIGYDQRSLDYNPAGPW